jgi:tetratricopeptide (TPR) repeat protein/type II secretory pathway predicted ATPase ExeA
MGDAALAYFGYPKAHEDDAERAIRAGLQVVDAVRRLKPSDPSKLKIRVGIATGLVLVGDTSRTGLLALDQDVVGVTPSLAARLQAIAGPDEVVVSSSTRRLAAGLFEYRDLGPISLKGFDKPVSAWRVLAPRAIESRFDAQHEAGISPLVGREEELNLLVRRWQQAKSIGGRVILILGEPGIGKSRIRRALQEQLAGDHHIRMNFYCSPQHVDSPYYPIVNRIERWAGFANEDTAEQKASKLHSLLARSNVAPQQIGLVAELLSLQGAQRECLLAFTPEQRKQKTIEALLGPLTNLSKRRPMLVVVEDLHWIDPSSLEVLGLLLERVVRLRLLLVCTARTDFKLPWPSYAHMTVVTLSRLNQREATTLVRITAGGKLLPDAAVDQILARTDGVPLFIEELTKAVLESGLIREREGTYVLENSFASSAIPTTLHDSLMARLDRLGSVREVAQIGAVIGRDFSSEVLRAVSRLPARNVEQGLEHLVQVELLSRRGEVPSASYTFKHSLIRDAAYSTLLRGQRQDLHAHIAAVLEDRFPNLPKQEPELLGHHWTEAGLTEKAIGYWGEAGRNSAARHAKVEAIVHFRRALALLASLPRKTNHRRLELELECGLSRALMATRIGAEETGQSYMRARKLCDELNDTTTLVPVLGGLFMFHLGRCELGPARRTAEDLLQLGQNQSNEGASLAGNLFVGLCSYWGGEFAPAKDKFEQVLNFSIAEGDLSSAAIAAWDIRIAARCFLSLTLLVLGYPEQALSHNQQALAQSRQLRPPQILVRELTYAGLFSLLRRAENSALELAEEAIFLATERRYPFWLEVAYIIRGFALAVRGHTAEGLRLAREGSVDRQKTGSIGGQTYFFALLAQICSRANRPDEAWELLRTALQFVERTGERWFEAELHRIRGEWLIAHHPDAQAAAEALFQQALVIGRQRGAKLWELRAAVSLGRLWLRQGKAANAYDLLEPLYGAFTEGFDTPDLTEAKALIDMLWQGYNCPAMSGVGGAS